MRNLIAFCLLTSCASAQAPLTKILLSELNRNFTILKQKGDPPPYFLAYEVTETESDTVSASRGALETQNHGHLRQLDVTIRTGDPKFDNYRRVSDEAPARFTTGMALALDDNPAAIKQSVWLSTDRVYRAPPSA